MKPFTAALLFYIALSLAGLHARDSAETVTVSGISYHPPEAMVADPDQRCLLDIVHPATRPGFATLVWFHGGGLTGGRKGMPTFDGQGVALVAAGYRLSPQAKCPEFIEDAAAAVAWTIKTIAHYGGDTKKVFIGGHSAGGYLAAMVGMDPRWLQPHGLTPQSIAGLIPVSAQATTHFHVKELRGIPGPSLRPVIDEFAPLHHVSKNLPPICLILGDRRIEFKCRVEENELLFATLRNLEHPEVEFHELKDFDHNTVTQGAARLMPLFIERISQSIEPASQPTQDADPPPDRLPLRVR
ncbi:MAG: alpha/beta hydrolase [Verrucomicrobiales bacterium]